MKLRWQHPMKLLNFRKSRDKHREKTVNGNRELHVAVAEHVKAQEMFGPGTKQQLESLDRQLKGIGGTLHVTKEEDVTQVSHLAWKLSQQTKLPTVVVFRATQ
jgi:hypothetical protein